MGRGQLGPNQQPKLTGAAMMVSRASTSMQDDSGAEKRLGRACGRPFDRSRNLPGKQSLPATIHGCTI